MFYELPFWMDIQRLFTKLGKFLFNSSVGRKGKSALRDLKEAMGGHFMFRQLDAVENTNSLLVNKHKIQAG